MEGERVRLLAPLEVPEPGVPLARDSLRRYSALLLFAERAAQAGARPPEGADVEVIGDICRRLDGLPLTLELAAARAPTMSLATLLARLREEEGLLVLGTSVRTAEDRHRTLLATMEWSYGLLTRDERRLLARLSVFAGTFEAPAAARIGGIPAAGARPGRRPALQPRQQVPRRRGPGGGRRGEFETGGGLIEEAATIFASIGERSGVAHCRGWQGELLLREGRLGQAREHLTEALRIFADMPDGWMVANVRDLLGWLGAAERDPYRAVRLGGAASAVRHLIGASPPPALAAVLTSPLQQVRSALGDRAERAYQEGAGASVERAIAYALREEPVGQSGESAPRPASGGLTQRELEVVPLVAQGLSDREIATLLRISVRTAEYHLDRIRIKLGCRSRAQIAAWAVMHGIVAAARR